MNTISIKNLKTTKITASQLKVLKGGTEKCELAVEKLETVITS